MNGQNSIQNAPARRTEGLKTGDKLSGQQAQRGESAKAPRRGRPPGAKNKPKSLLPPEIADEMLLKMRSMLPAEHFDYMKSVIRDGKAISTKNELDVLVLLLARNLYPALIMEQFVTEDDNDVDDFFKDGGENKESDKKDEPKLKMPVFRKDVTERLKVLQGLLSLRNQVEKRDSDSRDEDKPILKIVGGRGFDASRLRLLVGVESAAVAGNTDGTGFTAYPTGTVPDQIPERSVVLPSGEQVEADRVLDGDSR